MFEKMWRCGPFGTDGMDAGRSGTGRRGTPRAVALALIVMTSVLTACVLIDCPESDAVYPTYYVGPADRDGNWTDSVETWFRGESVPQYSWSNFSMLIQGSGPMADFGAPGSDTQAPWFDSEWTLPDGVTRVDAPTYLTDLYTTQDSGTVTHIGDYAFCGFHNLYFMNIADVTSVGDHAFAGCSKLEKVVKFNELKHIGDNAFANTPIGEWDFGDAADVELGTGIFSGCGNLTKITFGSGFSTRDGQSIADANLTDRSFGKYVDGAFVRITDNGDFVGHTFTYDSSVDAYVQDDPDAVTWNIGPLKDGEFTDTVKATLSGGTLTVTGSGPMADFGQENSNLSSPWCVKYAYNKQIKTVTIQDGVTTIGSYAFGSCYYLESVTIPDSVVSIGLRAFELCGFTSITIPDSVTAIGEYAFMGSDLVSLRIPGTVTTIGKGMLAGNTDLASVTLGNGIGSIAQSMFYNCPELKSISIPDSVEVFGDYCFLCSGLEDFDFGDLAGVTLGKKMFGSCKDLKTISFGSGFSVGNGQSIADTGIADYGFVDRYYTDIDGNDGFLGQTFTFDPDRSVYVADGGAARIHSVIYRTADDGGGSSVWRTVEVEEDADFLIIGDVPERSGHSFLGWTDGEDTYQPGGRMRMGADDIILTAVWERVLWTVNYSDGTDVVLSESVDGRNGTFAVTSYIPEKDGFVFGGWEYHGMTVRAGDMAPLDEDAPEVLLTAVWTGEDGPDAFVPAIPDDAGDWIPVSGNDGGGAGKDRAPILLMAAVAAIIAELALLCVTGRR